jgi:pyruvate formate lyase activating enzyme
MSVEHENLNRAPKNPEDVKGTVFNIQRYSIQDGPGIRTTVFLKGCPLRCAWCSNPESQNPRPEIAHRDSLCTQCGRCVDVCEAHAISIGAKSVTINRGLCTDCGRCAAVCMPGALKIFGEEMSAAEVFRQVRKDEDFYRVSGGGVTVSGGEPLSQPDFVAALFRLCRENGIHTCIETCGLAGVRALEKVLRYTSLVLYDIKLADPAAHRKWTGRRNETILRNLGLVRQKGIPVIIRVPLIPGINDTDAALEDIARLAARFLPQHGNIELLPYHRFGLGKYQMLDRQYRLAELTTQSEAQVQRARQIFESAGFKCEISG